MDIPSSGVKKAAIEEIGTKVADDQRFLGDIRNLVDHFGVLYQGMVIEVSL